ncbi:MAG: hypothetical protein A3H52_02980 [Candidatus Zambryskibacteria bacterium RIFCSPLOWO2_02_FULL_39_26]|uniref:Methyltransferase type 11 domain-containing protein n=1 Tax=Candidatus Zambryskibacteria bacterium RIFCSPLOWO2_12_FULL_39_23 TaxID=1802776 RepID=A0A1G2UUI9_9BACT|nr:MAG: hypothetical protein A3E59_01995 [Candidatus Zambryskibacteria bacterium RIFCSPHIGHO2_12_FULL_39_47]OHB10551.1 MAG: hypothetical protein A3H52_02980 [Candidatus Zambryskibacteria bacterium RIFCSPLOWO2_02_FULL_39_26]OHB13077.1 MAG: hypothetical protein A3G99_00595 [Candidatus Zambryskibacteria bacterium RIFCSPLOWO2_12_FULL_39_23]
MSFSIEKVAKDYVYRRFTRASTAEKEKIINDWVNKINDSQALVEDFKDRVGNPAGKKILDVGSGSGGVSIAFVLAGANMTGIDIEKELYEIAKLHAENCKVKVNFFLYDGNKLPFSDNTFDYAVSVSVLEHTTSPENYLSEILRVVKLGGKCYLAFPNKFWPKETHTGIWGLTYSPAFMRSIIIKILRKNPLEENNLHFYTYFDLMRMIKTVKTGEFSWYLIPEQGKAKSGIKKIIKDLLSIFGLSYKVFLSHVLVILEKRS